MRREQKAFLQKLLLAGFRHGFRGARFHNHVCGKPERDVLIAWENEAITTMKSYPDEYEMITPSVSILRTAECGDCG